MKLQIYEFASKILNKVPAGAPKTYDSHGNSLDATSHEGKTEFPAYFALLKQKRKMCGRRSWAKSYR